MASRNILWNIKLMDRNVVEFNEVNPFQNLFLPLAQILALYHSLASSFFILYSGREMHGKGRRRRPSKMNKK
jgi:hypothetical protein